MVAAAVASGAVARPVSASEVSDDEIVFGMSAALVNTTEKELGYQARLAFDAALAAQNARGGVHGRRLKLVALDDGYDPAKCAVATRQLVEKHSVFAFTNGGTPNAMVSAPYANDKKIPYLSGMTGSLVVRNDPPDRYVFIYRASYAEETAAAVRYLITVRGIRPSRIAVFSQDDAFGDAAFEGVAKIMRQFKHNPRSVLRAYYKRNSTDVDQAVATINKARSRVDAVIIAATFKPAARFIERVRDTGTSNIVFSAISVVGATELAEELTQLGPRYADGVIITQVVPDPDSRGTAMIRYREEIKRHSASAKPSQMSLESWIGAQIWIEALKRAGRNVTREGFIDALESIREWDIGLGVNITFGPSEHQGSHKVWGTILDRNGRILSLASDWV